MAETTLPPGTVEPEGGWSNLEHEVRKFIEEQQRINAGNDAPLGLKTFGATSDERIEDALEEDMRLHPESYDPKEYE